MNPQQFHSNITLKEHQEESSEIKFVNYDIVFQEFPDEISLAINLSCCPNNCRGCHSAYLRQNIGEVLTTERLFALIDKYQGSITCVGLMGGDNNPNGIEFLCKAIKEKYPTLKTGWYSGKSDWPKNFNKSCFDYVKLGAYKQELGPINYPTTNQRMYKFINGQAKDITARFWKNKTIT